MRDKTEDILNAAEAVFIKKGLQATTQEIADEASVAEVTIYRKFSTKQNLFRTVIKNVLEKQFGAHVQKLAQEENTELFLTLIIENRLDVLSRHIELVKMLIAESLRRNLYDDIDFTSIIYSTLKEGLNHHFDGRDIDTEFCARQLGGIFLSYVALPGDAMFYKWSAEEKRTLAKKHARSVMAVL